MGVAQQLVRRKRISLLVGTPKGIGKHLYGQGIGVTARCGLTRHGRPGLGVLIEKEPRIKTV